LLQKALDGCLDLAELRLSDRGSGDQHHIPPWGKCGATEPHDLSQPAADPIPQHGAADPLADRETKATGPQIIGQDAQHYQAMRPTFPLAADLIEAIAPAQPVIPFQGLPGPLTIGNRGSQTLASAQAAPLDHLAPITGAHALTKTVHAQPPAHLGLISSFGHGKDRTPFF
jgi:hypothetical protein